jgi:hypothetical protein
MPQAGEFLPLLTVGFIEARLALIGLGLVACPRSLQ